MAHQPGKGGRRPPRRITAVTNDALITREAALTGIPVDQLLLIVARSVVVRSLAANPEYRERLVLKGGTLLYHVYRSPRASFRDADFGAERGLNLEELQTALTVDELGFSFQPADGTWSQARGILEGADLPFSITNIRPRRRGNYLKMTVSVRQAEQLDRQPVGNWPAYEDTMLIGESQFPVNALTLNELASEKFLGFALHGQPKHFIDLALIGRDHSANIDTDRVLDLIGQKFRSESTSPDTRADYQTNGLTNLNRIPAGFGAASLRRIESQWDSIRRSEVVFANDARRHPAFTNFAEAARAFDDQWANVLQSLRRRGR